MCKVPGTKELQMEANHDLFTEIVVSKTMYSDHIPLQYEKALQKLINSQPVI